MRGTQIADYDCEQCLGIIPAHAGNTMGLGVRRRGSEDHPRTCGEHSVAHAICFSLPGSSPHMRGTPVQEDGTSSRMGIIPAHAGNTFSYARWTPNTRDHPRTCGEHLAARWCCPSPLGSSPHMRGTLLPGDHFIGKLRIIPAHAGNTSSIVTPKYSDKDHPRTCGEHKLEWCGLRLGAGSSPHMRGTLCDRVHHGQRFGIIPAHAGNTVIWMPWIRPGRDHPRTCGEHVCHPADNWTSVGSSPHMRGTPNDIATDKAISGIIPAHAGNTWNDQIDVMASGDHPRTCGEHIH